MAEKRKNDPAAKTWFRTERLVQNGGQWFFLTREGSTEGPFDSRWEAEQRLERYIGLEMAGMLGDDLTILPKE